MRVAGIVLAFVLTMGAAAAQGTARPGPPPLNGTIESFAGGVLTVVVADGTRRTVTVPNDLLLTADAPRKFSDVELKDFVGVTATKTGTTFTAEEIHIYPEAMRGVAEGRHELDRADHILINAQVAVLPPPPAATLTLLYPGGHQLVAVTAETRIREIVPVGPSDLKPGLQVSIGVNRLKNGAAIARRLTVEKDGVKPF